MWTNTWQDGDTVVKTGVRRDLKLALQCTATHAYISSVGSTHGTRSAVSNQARAQS
jgi:hypothetical protein